MKFCLLFIFTVIISCSDKDWAIYSIFLTVLVDTPDTHQTLAGALRSWWLRFEYKNIQKCEGSQRSTASYFNNISSKFRYNSHYLRVFISKEKPNRHLHWGVLYYCVYQGQTLPTLNSRFFKISPYQRYYLDCRSSLTQWARPVSGNHGNNLIRLISESEYLPQSCFSEHLPLLRVLSVSVCVRHLRLPMERFILVFVPFVRWDCFLACWEEYFAYACPVLIIKSPERPQNCLCSFLVIT